MAAWCLTLPVSIFGYSSLTARAGADIANYTYAMTNAYGEGARNEMSVVEIDSEYLQLRQQSAWPPRYDILSLIISGLVEDAKPTGLAIDIYFERVRPDEGWGELLLTLCQLGGQACDEPEGAMTYCSSTEVDPSATRVFLSVIPRRESEENNAQESLRRLSRECGHVERFSVSRGASFEKMREYPVSWPGDTTNSGNMDSLAVGVFKSACRHNWFSRQIEGCQETLDRLEDFERIGASLEFVWSTRRPAYDWQTKTVLCGSERLALGLGYEQPNGLGSALRIRARNPCPHANVRSLSDLYDNPRNLEEISDRFLFIASSRHEERDPFYPVGGVSVKGSGVLSHHMALDNLITLGPHTKSSEPVIGGWRLRGWAFFVYSYVAGVFLLILFQNRSERPSSATSFSSANCPWVHWVSSALIALFLSFVIYVVIGSICFFLLDWGFSLWVTSLTFGTAASLASALGLRSQA